jgi:[ribosomal protein S5]-alanine N-acetyltransferase
MLAPAPGIIRSPIRDSILPDPCGTSTLTENAVGQSRNIVSSDTTELPMDVLKTPQSFETTRLLLRPVVLSDASDIYGYASDVEATKFMTFSRHRSLDESHQFAGRCVACWQDRTAYPWAIVARDTAIFAGIIEMRIRPPKADFGYILCKTFWGHGYATEASKAIVSWAIGQPTIFRVWATCHPDNVRSAKVLGKSGLMLEGRLANWEARPNIDEPAGESLIYALTRSARG